MTRRNKYSAPVTELFKINMTSILAGTNKTDPKDPEEGGDPSTDHGLAPYNPFINADADDPNVKYRDWDRL